MRRVLLLMENLSGLRVNFDTVLWGLMWNQIPYKRWQTYLGVVWVRFLSHTLGSRWELTIEESRRGL
ncbi:hypothetical protein ACS0TY_031423 [Phlomoides rotata]